MPRSNYGSDAEYNASRKGDLSSAYDEGMKPKKKKKNKKMTNKGFKTSASTVGGGGVGGAGG